MTGARRNGYFKNVLFFMYLKIAEKQVEIFRCINTFIFTIYIG